MLNLCTFLIFVLLLLGSSEHVESVMDEVEKYMMTRLYKEVFCPESTDDEKKDLAIQKRIRLANKMTLCLNLVIMDISAFCLGTRKYSCSSKNFSRLTSIVMVMMFHYRALHWVTIEMLCVPVDEEIAESSDSVVKAITGKSHCFSDGYGRIFGQKRSSKILQIKPFISSSF